MSEKTLADFHEGQRVLYVPYHADGNSMHPDCERGVVSSVSDHYVFVRFNPRSIAQACEPDQLR